MSDGKFVFDYIKNYFNKALDYLDKNNTLLISGEARIGKTYLAQLCLGKVSDTDYYKLYLQTYEKYNPSYYPFLLGLGQSDAIYETGKEIISDVVNNSDKISIKVIEKIIKYSLSYEKNYYSQLNDSEVSIINRINIHCKKRSLFLVADNIENWDEESKNLLSFFVTPEAQKNIPFLKNSKIIIIANNEDSFKDLVCNKQSFINIKGFKTKESFLRDFRKMAFGSDDLAEELYQITNGNLGIAYDLKYYAEGNSIDEKKYTQIDEMGVKNIFLSIIDKRVKKISEITPQFANTIKAASIQGFSFYQRYLPYTLDADEFVIERALSLAEKEHILSLINDKENFYCFLNNYLYKYFDENYNEYRKEYHYKFAQAAKKLRPSDYLTQYLHLRAAGKNYEAAENLVIYLVRQKIKKQPNKDKQLTNYLQTISDELYNNYLLIDESIDYYNKNLYEKALSSLELISPVSEIILWEKDYLVAYYIYDGCLYKRNIEACSILNNAFKFLLDRNFDIWLRNGLLFYIFNVNRLHDEIAAKNIEKNIMKEIAKRYQDDASLETIIHVLNRNSGALYSTEIALGKTEKSVMYFEKYSYLYPLDYIYALSNYSGLLFCSSEYEKGYNYAYKAIRLINEKNILIKNISKIISNYLINGVMSSIININTGLTIFENLINKQGLKNVLLKNNYYILKALSGHHIELLDDFNLLFWSDSVQKHNDYYVYLIGINYIFSCIINGDLNTAKIIYNFLDERIPSICKNEEYIIKKRYIAYKEIIEDSQNKCLDIHSLESLFSEKLCDINSDYARKPYILTDQQFWTAI